MKVTTKQLQEMVQETVKQTVTEISWQGSDWEGSYRELTAAATTALSQAMHNLDSAKKYSHDKLKRQRINFLIRKIEEVLHEAKPLQF